MIIEFDGQPIFREKYRILPVRVTDEYIRGSIPMHSHAADSVELHFILAGKGQVRTPDAAFALDEGSFYITPGGQAHEQNSDAATPVRELCVYASLLWEKKSGAHADVPFPRRFFIGRADAEMLHAAHSIASELAERREGRADAVRHLIGLLLIYAERAEQNGRPDGAGRECGVGSDLFLKIEEAFLYGYRTLTLSSLANAVGMSGRQLQRVLRTRYGATFTAKRTEARMRAANLLLSEGTLPVTRIAEETGYSCIEHFCAEYKKIFGIAPGEYRKRLRRSQTNGLSARPPRG